MEDGVLSSIRKKIDNNITEIEYRTDLTDDEKVNHIIKIFAVTCSGIALQPIPFADVFILTPLQGYMGTRIANIRGIKISEQEGSDIVKEMITLGGMGYLAQQTAIGIFKMIPGLGSLLSIPVVISLTYAIGKVMDAHFKSKSMGRTLPKSELQKIFKQAKREAEDKKDLISSQETYPNEKSHKKTLNFKDGYTIAKAKSDFKNISDEELNKIKVASFSYLKGMSVEALVGSEELTKFRTEWAIATPERKGQIVQEIGAKHMQTVIAAFKEEEEVNKLV